MADTKLTALTELTAPALDDWLYAVDKSDTTDDAAGSSRKILNSSLMQYMPHGLSEISVTGATTATIGRMHVCSGTTSDYTLTLPAASGNTGKVIVVRMATGLTKLVTIDGNASETIDGSLTRIMWAGESAILLCDGSNWFKIGGKSIPMTCTMRRASDQTGVETATLTLVSINGTDLDNTSRMANTGSNRVDIIRTSYYLVSGVVPLESTGTRAIAYCEKNLSGNILKQGECPGGTGNAVPHPVFVANVLFTAGDYLQLKCYHNQGTNASVISTANDDAAFLTLIEQISW